MPAPSYTPPVVVTPSRPPLVEGLRPLRLVGRGGEGEVWEARDGRGRRRALKLVRPECLAEPSEVAVRGAWLVRIQHPALVRVHRSGVLRDDGLFGWGFVEMDFVDGDSLAAAPPDPGALDRLAPLAEGIDLLHAGLWSDGVPLVHRDVKPANIVEAADGSYVLVDPSTLRGLDATQLTRIGTPVFAAPEVLSGRAGPAADVYSFAATVVALATGLRGRELADLVAAPHRLDLPPGVVQALSPHPGDRPASCRAVLSEAEETVAWYPLQPGHAGGDDGWDERCDRRDRTLVDHAGAWRDDLPRSPRAEEVRPAPWEGGAARGSEQPRPRPALPWVAALALLGATGAVAGRLVLEPEAVPAAAALGVPADLVLPAVLAALLVLHLLCALVARAPIGLAVLVPPLGWATILGDRLAETGRRRAYARTVSLPGCTAVLGAAAVVLAEPLRPEGPALWPLGVAAVLVAVTAARGTGAWGAMARLLALPLFAAGAVLTVALAAALLPLAVLVGGGRTLGRYAGGSLAALPEAFRGPRPW